MRSSWCQECAIVDAAHDSTPILAAVAGRRVVAIVLTHERIRARPIIEYPTLSMIEPDPEPLFLAGLGPARS